MERLRITFLCFILATGGCHVLHLNFTECIFRWTDLQQPFIRVIQPEERWLYRNPYTEDVTVSTPNMFVCLLNCFYFHFISPTWFCASPGYEPLDNILFRGAEFGRFNAVLFQCVVVLVPSVLIVACGIFIKRFRDTRSALLGLTMSLLLNGCITNGIKLMVGRPRPDFMARCFPDGNEVYDGLAPACTGAMDAVIEGRKSFPSGHSSCK